MNGIVLVDKPVGMSSHSAVAVVRRRTGIRKVGHAGTLDPAASGLLLLGIGSATRLLTFLVGLAKTYTTTIRLGVGTDTDDAEGRVVARPGCPPDVDLTAALTRFEGTFDQRPSAVSAIKVDGKRAYHRVRSGEDVQLAARTVTVSRLTLSNVRPALVDDTPVLDVDLTLEVSSGTYIRAIARDLGSAVGSAGHLIALRRTAVGPFSVDDALAPDDVSPSMQLLTPGGVAGQVMRSVHLDRQDSVAVSDGARLPCDGDGDDPIALLDGDGRLRSVARCESGRWRHLMVVPSATLGEG